jgi:uncharacterized membrane protein
LATIKFSQQNINVIHTEVQTIVRHTYVERQSRKKKKKHRVQYICQNLEINIFSIAVFLYIYGVYKKIKILALTQFLNNFVRTGYFRISSVC